MQHTVYNCNPEDLKESLKCLLDIFLHTMTAQNQYANWDKDWPCTVGDDWTKFMAGKSTTPWETVFPIIRHTVYMCCMCAACCKCAAWNLISEFRFCARGPQIAVISSLLCTKQYNGNAETRMNGLISFYFKRLAFSPSLGPLASSGPPGVPSRLSKTGNVPYFTRHLEMSQSLTVENPT